VKKKTAAGVGGAYTTVVRKKAAGADSAILLL
jgi:hypothetical protein